MLPRQGQVDLPRHRLINSNARGPGNVGYSERVAPASFSRLLQGGWLADKESFAITRSGFVPTG